jgi:bile acid-coenzyme A ligase
MFTVGGRNVYPAEMESALAEHPDILSSLAVGVPDEDLGQVPHALAQAAVDLDEASARALDAGKARRSAVRDGVIARRRALAHH